MNEVFNLPDIAKKVQSFLVECPESRDDDRYLMALVWQDELCDFHADFDSFVALFIHGKLSNPESITRCRRKIQEKSPWLRGKRWDQRHGLEPVMVNELQSI